MNMVIIRMFWGKIRKQDGSKSRLLKLTNADEHG